MPSMSGICRSINTTSNSPGRMSPSASRPFEATVTIAPLASSTPLATSWFTSSSSTTRIRAPARLDFESAASDVLGLPGICMPATRPHPTVKRKVLPAPGSLSTSIFPPMAVARRSEIDSPSPVPLRRRVLEVSTCEKGWNRPPICAALMPMPVSFTANSRTAWLSSPPGTRSTTHTETFTDPCSVNLTAFVHRLARTWPMRSPSATSLRGTPSATTSRNSTPFCCALMPVMESTSSSNAFRSNSTGSITSLPASILERSRMSLMMCKSEFAATPIRDRCSLTTDSGCASCARWVMPRIAFIGVRISWLMLARKSLLARFAASAASLACSWRTSRSARSACKTARRIYSSVVLSTIAVIAPRNRTSVAPSMALETSPAANEGMATGTSIAPANAAYASGKVDNPRNAAAATAISTATPDRRKAGEAPSSTNQTSKLHANPDSAVLA